MMIGLGFLPYGGNFTGVAIVISIMAVGSGILQPIIPSMISKYAPDNQQGATLGFSQSVSAFARVLVHYGEDFLIISLVISSHFSQAPFSQ